VKVHIAARHGLRTKAAQVAARLKRVGHEVVSRWIDGRGQGVPAAEDALYTLTDIVVADCVVFLSESPWEPTPLPGANDRHVEFGYALRSGKRLCLLGPRETGFCHLPQVERYSNVRELIHGLR
jgi:hypothetical protein